MTSSAAIFLIVVAAGAAIFFVAKIGWAAAGKRRQGRHVQADKLREAAKQETRRVRRQEVLVYQAAVKARAVQDKADVQAAVQAARAGVRLNSELPPTDRSGVGSDLPCAL